MSSESTARELLTVSLVPEGAPAVSEVLVDFELDVPGASIRGNSSRESCWEVFEKLPADFRHEMLLRGSSADIWGDTIWGMTKDAYAPAHGPVRLEYHETEDKGVLRYRHSWEQDPGWLWQVDLDLEIIWSGVSHRTRICLPDRKTATPYFWVLLPSPARDFLAKRGCTSEMLNDVVLELWQMSNLFPEKGIANVGIEIVSKPYSSHVKFTTDGKDLWYPYEGDLAISETARWFVISAVSKLSRWIPYRRAIAVACELAAEAELTLKATTGSSAIDAMDSYIKRIFADEEAVGG